ncbi:hypothetical protein GOODEAATRI_009704 [Goodea atripinnis]|uniref:cGMP-dependent protein kinase interacting domain-containing protein n=1 Tax=Goodea atripinnis TaxID=208336 RepID=A0ABV0NIV4_9TELE
MGDTAKTKRREQLKRWAGSCTDRTSDVPRRRWRGDAEAEPSCDPPVEQQPDPAGRDEISPIPSGRKRVRFDSAAEFLAACASGDTEEAKAMLEETEQSKTRNGENLPDIINCSNSDGITALHQACIDGSIEIVTFLLERGANVNQVDSVDVDAAKRKEEEQMMSDARTWLNEGPPDDVRHPRTGATPLHVAAAKGYVEALKILCQCGLDVSATDFDGWTPLHAAAHWGQEEACRILAEQLCNMEARSNGVRPGRTSEFSLFLPPLNVCLPDSCRARRRTIELRFLILTHCLPSFASRTSVCRMSSKDKINVQDLSKERGVSGGLDMSEEKESSTGKSARPKEKAEDEEQKEEEEEKEQDKASRTARVQPTPQTKEAAAENPNAPNADKKQQQPKQFQAADRDEESESQRKARCRLMRQSRRLTQGVTLTELKEAEKSVGKAADPPPPPRNVQSVSPIITVTPAERGEPSCFKIELTIIFSPSVFVSGNDLAKQVESEGDSRLGAKDRRRGRKERRSTGIVPPVSELYIKVLQENMTLKDKLQEMELQLSQNKVELERLRQVWQVCCFL